MPEPSLASVEKEKTFTPGASLASVEPSPNNLDHLSELALNLRNSWSHATHSIWSAIDPELWELTHNPWVVLQTTAHSKLEELSRDSQFAQQIRSLVEEQRQYLNSPAWFQHTHIASPLSCVAFFSMEFGVSEALPIY